MKNDYYIYKEFDNQNGRYKERTNITRIFEDIEELLKFINERKEFYKSFWNTRTITIDIIEKENNNGK